MTTQEQSTASYPYWPISIILSILSMGGAFYLLDIVDKNLRIGLWSFPLEFFISVIGAILALCSWAFLSVENK